MTKNLDVSPEKVTDDEIIISFKNSAFDSSVYKGMIQSAADIVGIKFTQFNIEKKNESDYKFVMSYVLNR